MWEPESEAVQWDLVMSDFYGRAGGEVTLIRPLYVLLYFMYLS